MLLQILVCHGFQSLFFTTLEIGNHDVGVHSVQKFLSGSIENVDAISQNHQIFTKLFHIWQQMTAEEQEKREAGFVELFVKDGTQTTEGLVNIELKPAYRRGGTGRLVIQSLKDTFGELKIYDIKKKAVPFWRKMGATFYGDQHFTKPLDAVSKARTGLYAII